MGASTSTLNNSQGVLTLDSMIAEANGVLVKTTELISQTVQSEIGNKVGDVQERVAAKIGSTFSMVRETLDGLARQSAEARECVQRKEPELQSIQLKMKNEMLQCYNKHNDALEKLRAERAIIHTEAKQFKIEVQKTIENCMLSGNRFECFRTGLAQLAEKVDVLLKKFQALVKRETEMRANCAIQYLECDKKAIIEANKNFKRVIEEIKKCDLKSINTN